MSDRNKNRKKELEDFLRYSQDQMSEEERNAFERSLQQDPFDAEALEGLSSNASGCCLVPGLDERASAPREGARHYGGDRTVFGRAHDLAVGQTALPSTGYRESEEH